MARKPPAQRGSMIPKPRIVTRGGKVSVQSAPEVVALLASMRASENETTRRIAELHEQLIARLGAMIEDLPRRSRRRKPR